MSLNCLFCIILRVFKRLVFSYFIFIILFIYLYIYIYIIIIIIIIKKKKLYKMNKRNHKLKKKFFANFEKS